MINRFYLKDYLSFKEVELEFKQGLIVFTGPSGAGKSILMDSFLSLFGIKEAKAILSEISLDSCFEDESFGIEENEEIIIKEIKKEKVRYFLNNQTISKKNLSEISKNLIKHLHVKDTSDFENDKLIEFLDLISISEDSKFKDLQQNYQNKYTNLDNINKELQKIYTEESKVEELKEYIKFEIDKIESVNPKIGEYEELSEIKKTLSKKDKIEEAINLANPIFNHTSSVSKALELMGKESNFFDEAINELTNTFESFSDSLDSIEDLDIEDVLDRIENLSSLQKRFGSIEEALVYKEKKKEELEFYDNISFEKMQLEKKQQKTKKEVEELAILLTKKRETSSKILQKKINEYLDDLYLSNAKISIDETNLSINGKDKISFELNGVDLEKISSGEFNRLRLALLSSMTKYQISHNGILFLDEIDANLSGKESEAIAKVLKEIAKSYQIFVVSHQPQLTSLANQHFLVEKIDGYSTVRELAQEERITEVSRMISGAVISDEAKIFAKNLINN